MEAKQNSLQKTWLIAVLALTSCLLWGSAFPCIKIGYNLFSIKSSAVNDIIVFAGYRFTLAGIMVVAITSVLQKKIAVPKKKNLMNVFLLSLAQTAVQYTLFYIGMANTTAVKSSIIGGSSVFISIIFSCFVFRQESFTAKKLLGCIAGFTGIVIINLGGGSLSGFSLSGEGCIILSNISYALSSVMMKAYSKNEDPMILSGYQFLCGGILLITVGSLLGGRVPLSVSGAGAVDLLYLSFLSAAAYTLWGLLLKYNPVSKVMIFFFATPVFGVLLSGIFLGDYSKIINFRSLAALVLVSGGIFISNFTLSKTTVKKA